MEVEIDKEYVDSGFVELLNQCGLEDFRCLFAYLIENYSDEMNFEKLSYLRRLVSAVFGSESDASSYLRRLKYLINKAICNRVSKKLRDDLSNLKLNNERIEVISSLIKLNYNKINNENRQKQKKNYYEANDIHIETVMPVYNTNKMKQKGENKDIKQQSLILNFDLLSASSKEFKSSQFELDKNQLRSLYEEIEKAQEKLDKLY